jgi:hypothetical protein
MFEVFIVLMVRVSYCYMHLLLGNRLATVEQGVSCWLALGNRTLQRLIGPLLGKQVAQEYRRRCFPFGPPQGHIRKVVERNREPIAQFGRILSAVL